MVPIFTLDARNNVALEVARDYFNLSNAAIRREIMAAHQITREILKRKEIPYEKLKNAVVPRTTRHEAAFVFDRRRIPSYAYGREVFRAILPLLKNKTTQSVLHGDLVGNNQDLIQTALRELICIRDYQYRHGNDFYCVYLNNLSKVALESLHEKLARTDAYLGYIPTTYESIAKTYLSFTLANCFVKCRSSVIMGHEDDVSDDENCNVVGFPFEDFGYRVLSFRSMYYDMFLSYKIERRVYQGFEIDTEMSLNALSESVLGLEDFEVLLDDAKHNYLKTSKNGLLERAQISDLDAASLARLIKEKIKHNYIYNIEYNEQYDVGKFNVMIEIPRQDDGHPTRLVAALEYIPITQHLRMLTVT